MKKVSNVCLDTQIMIWGIKEESSQSQIDMIRKAKALLHELDQRKIKAIVPALVIAELLMGTPPQNHLSLCEKIEKKFIVPPFDTLAAAWSARIWQSKKEEGVIKNLREQQAMRNELKVDCMIVATAVANGASCIYSEDPHIRKIAEGYMVVKTITDISLQEILF